MSIVFHHFKQLTECIEQVEWIEDRVNSKNKGLTIKEEEKQEEKEEVPPLP